jgi:uncharacterized membrane protein YfhO
MDPAHDPWTTVVLLAGDVPAGGVVPTGATGSARIVEYTPNRVAVRVSSSHAGYLVLADTWDPDWHATVDGKPARVLRADAALRAVRVGPGEHSVVFEYRPAGLVAGLVASVAAALVLALSWWRSRRGGMARSIASQ